LCLIPLLRLCHQWGFEDLESSICEYLQAALHVGNVCAILDTALTFGLQSLVNTCSVFGDANAGTLLEHPSFLNLSPVGFEWDGYCLLGGTIGSVFKDFNDDFSYCSGLQAGVTELISRDSFCAAEEKIFECVANWVRHNAEIHSDASSVLDSVRLPLMNINTLLENVRPTSLVSPDCILDAIEAQKKARDTELRYRGYLGMNCDSSFTLASLSSIDNRYGSLF
jgi:BTB/POZ domain-containing protein 9